MNLIPTMNLQTKQIMEELKKTRKELTLATEAEEKSRKAMDQLASVLQEVAAEANETKQELKVTNNEKEQIRLKLESTEEKMTIITSERNEFKNAAERLRLEADETLANWNVKESGLVECMKKVEEERSRAQAEVTVLQEEMKKLRDILKQAMTEAISAKESASLVKVEYSKLKENLDEKDTALNFISRELETLRASEAAARRSLNDLKLQLSESVANSSDSLKVEKQQEIKPRKVEKKAFNFGLGCSGRSKWQEEFVDKKANKVVVARDGTRDGGASSLTGSVSCRFSDDAWNSRGAGLDSLKKKTLSKRFGGLLIGSSKPKV